MPKLRKVTPKQRAINTPLARSKYGYARGKQYQAQQMQQIKKFFKP